MRSLFKYPTKLFALMVYCFIGFNILFLLLSGLVFYSTYSDLAYREIRETKKELLEETSQKLSNYVSGMQDTARFLVTNELIRGYLSSYPDSFFDFYSKSKGIYEQFQKLLSVNTGVHSIELYTNWNSGYKPVQDNFLYSIKDAQAQGWLSRMDKADGFWIASHPYIASTSQVSVVSYIHRIIGDRGDTLGIVKINIPDVRLFNILSKRLLPSNNDDYYVVMDSAGNYFTSTIPSELLIRFGSKDLHSQEFSQAFRVQPESTKDVSVAGRKYNVIYTESNSEYWELLQFISKDVFLENGREIRQLTIWLLTALILISIPLAFWISRRLTSPINRIVDGMRSLENGDFNVRMGVSSIQEYMYLMTHFNRMVHRLKQLIGRLNKEHRDRREAELQLLHAQIKPHFLYNTLDMIHWRALDYEAHEISQMVHQLSKLFRIGLSNDKWYVTVKDELDHARCYIAIQKFRQNFTITYTEHTENDVFACLIPKIVLQPFLENAVIHGYGNRTEDANLQVSVAPAYVAGRHCLLIDIVDNGSGLSKDFDIRLTSGIGIRNVIDRIQLYCGPEYGVEMSTLVTGGTHVSIRLPLIRDEAELDQLTRSLSHEYDSISG